MAHIIHSFLSATEHIGQSFHAVHLIGCGPCLSFIQPRPQYQRLPLLCQSQATLNSCSSLWTCQNILPAQTSEVRRPTIDHSVCVLLLCFPLHKTCFAFCVQERLLTSLVSHLFSLLARPLTLILAVKKLPDVLSELQLYGGCCLGQAVPHMLFKLHGFLHTKKTMQGQII